jgi:hypothetical protein
MALWGTGRGLADAPDPTPVLSWEQLARYGENPQRLLLDSLVAKAQAAYPSFEIALIQFPRIRRASLTSPVKPMPFWCARVPTGFF